MASVTLKGNPVTLNGDLPAVGSQAPDFSLVGADLGDVSLGSFRGKKKILSIVPSLDTPTCATSTRLFNEEAARLDDTVVYTQLVGEIGDEPDYAAALAALK